MAGDPINEISGDYRAGDARFGLVLSRFNESIGERLLAGALDMLRRHGVDSTGITLVRVPGAFEIPWALRQLAAGGGYDALIALGAVIRGATPHFDYVAGECAAGVRQVSLESGIPVAFGVLTVDTIEQAIERSGTKAGNKGADAAAAALELASLARQLAR